MGVGNEKEAMKLVCVSSLQKPAKILVAARVAVYCNRKAMTAVFALSCSLGWLVGIIPLLLTHREIQGLKQADVLCTYERAKTPSDASGQ